MRLGCCTASTNNATILSASTLDYVEENVQSFLVPTQGEEVFSAKLEQAQACGKPIAAACRQAGTGGGDSGCGDSGCGGAADWLQYRRSR